MPELNVNLPPIEVLVPWARVRQEPIPEKSFLPATLISACSIPGQPLLFQVLFEDGALYERLPVGDFWDSCRLNICAGSWFTESLQVWDCPSVHCVYTVYETVQDAPVNVVIGRWREPEIGTYVGTFDWYGDPVSEGVGTWGHKAAHFIRLDSGQFALLPNDRICWGVKAYTEPFDWKNPPKYRRNDKKFSVEGG